MIFKKHYLYTLQEDKVLNTNIRGKYYIGKWGMLYSDGRLEIKKGYSWDGATPRFIFSIPKLNFWTTFGTWNGPKGKDGFDLLHDCTLAHDFGNQNLRGIINYEEWQHLMTDCMEAKKFKYSRLYKFAIYAFGWIWWGKRKSLK